MSRQDTQVFLGHFWRVSFFQLLNSGSAFIINICAARLLGPALFGDFYFYVSTSVVAALLFDFGLTRTLLRYSAFHQARGEIKEKLQYYRSILKLKTWLGIIVLALGLAAVWLWGKELRLQLGLGLLTGFFVSYSQFLSGVAQTESDYATYNTVLSFNTLRLFLMVVLVAAGWFSTAGLYGVFLAAPLALALVPARRLGQDLVRAGRLPETHFYSKIVAFGKWMIVLAVLETVYQRLDVLLVRGLTSAEQAGYYSGALAFFSIVYMLPSYSAVLAYPRFVENVGRQDEAGLAAEYRFSTDLMSVLAIPMALGLWAVSPDLLATFLGSKFSASAPLFKYMAVYALLFGCHLNSGAVFFAKDQPQWVVFINACVLAVNLSANLMLIPWLGIAGAGWAICLAMLASLLLSWGLIRRRFRLWPDFQHLGQYLLAALAMAGLVKLWPGFGWGPLAVKIALGAAVYGGCLWGLSKLKGNEKLLFGWTKPA